MPISSKQLREALTGYSGEQGLAESTQRAELLPLRAPKGDRLTRFYRQAGLEVFDGNPISLLLQRFEETGDDKFLLELADRISHLGVVDIQRSTRASVGDAVELIQLVLVHRCSIQDVLGLE